MLKGKLENITWRYIKTGQSHSSRESLMQSLPIHRMRPVEQSRMKEIVLQTRNTAV